MDTIPILNFFPISVKNKRSSIPSTYLAGLFNLSRLIRPSTYCCMASEPKPFLHSAKRIARPSSFTAFEQFQTAESDLLNVSLLTSFPVLIMIILCLPISFTAIDDNDLEIEMVDDGCPVEM